MQVYLNRNVALVKRRNETLHCCHSVHGTKDLLAKLSASMQAKGSLESKKEAPLALALGGSLCKAVSIQLPEGLRNWKEMERARAVTAAAQLGVDADAVVVAGAFGLGGTVGAVLQEDMQAIREWMASINGIARRIEPVWALATQCRLAARKEWQCVVVEESDATTILAEAADGSKLATTFVMNGDPKLVQAQVNRRLVGMGIPMERTLRIQYALETTTPLANGPRCWQGHWKSVD